VHRVERPKFPVGFLALLKATDCHPLFLEGVLRLELRFRCEHMTLSIWSFFGVLLLCLICCCSIDISTDPNYVQEYQRVRNANLTALVLVDGILDCAIIRDVITALADINCGHICLHCDDASFFDVGLSVYVLP
jgi:hypothetical protein